MTNPTKSPAYGYLRVSTERQASEDRTSLEDQRAAIQQLANTLGVEVREWFTDPGVSGATAERPGFRALRAACEANPRPRGQPGYVLLLNASRLGRFDDSEESAYWRVHLRRLGWIVRYAEGDAEGDAAPIVRAVASLEATAYRKQLMANTRRGMKGAANLGFWTREAPYGFRRMVVSPPEAQRVLEVGQLKVPNEKVKLAPHEEEARVVRRVFQAYVSREHSATSLARELRRTDPGRRWSTPVVHAMLRNPAYAGDVVGGNRRGEKELLRGTPERYGMRDAHPPIVTRELWDAAQERMAENRKLGRPVKTTYLLTGLLTCPYCFHPYAGGGGGRSHDKKHVRELRRFYRDSGGVKGACPGQIGTVMRHIVEDAVTSTMSRTIRSAPVRRLIEDSIGRALSDARRGVQASEAGIRAALRKNEQRVARLVSLLADGTLLEAEARTQLAQLRQEAEQLTRQLDEARFLARRSVPLAQERDRLLQAALDFPALAARLTGLSLRRLISLWLERATFDKVSRSLELRILRVPRLSLQTEHSPARGLVLQGARPLVRRINLTQQGHSYRKALAAMEVGR